MAVRLISEHEQALANSEFYLAEEEARAKRVYEHQMAMVAQARKLHDFQHRQIEAAKAKGMASFDADRFMVAERKRLGF